MRTAGKLHIIHCRKLILVLLSLCKKPIAKGALAPPNRVAVPPIIAPHAIDINAANPNLLFLSTSAALIISMIIGNSIAATACSLIIKAEKLDKINILSNNLLGPFPNFVIIVIAILELSPDRMTGLANINAPRTKNTALFPK